MGIVITATGTKGGTLQITGAQTNFLFNLESVKVKPSHGWVVILNQKGLKLLNILASNITTIGSTTQVWTDTAAATAIAGLLAMSGGSSFDFLISTENDNLITTEGDFLVTT